MPLYTAMIEESSLSNGWRSGGPNRRYLSFHSARRHAASRDVGPMIRFWHRPSLVSALVLPVQGV